MIECLLVHRGLEALYNELVCRGKQFAISNKVAWETYLQRNPIVLPDATTKHEAC